MPLINWDMFASGLFLFKINKKSHDFCERIGRAFSSDLACFKRITIIPPGLLKQWWDGIDVWSRNTVNNTYQPWPMRMPPAGYFFSQYQPPSIRWWTWSMGSLWPRDDSFIRGPIQKFHCRLVRSHIPSVCMGQVQYEIFLHPSKLPCSGIISKMVDSWNMTGANLHKAG